MDLSTILDAIVKTSEQLQIKSNQTFSLDRTLGSLASITLTLGLYRILKSMKGKISNSGVVDLVKICLTSLLMGDVKDAQRRLKGRGDIDFSASADSVFEDDSNGGGYVKRLTGSCHCRSVSFVVSVSFLFCLKTSGILRNSKAYLFSFHGFFSLSLLSSNQPTNRT
jgi:hypothetical protein